MWRGRRKGGSLIARGEINVVGAEFDEMWREHLEVCRVEFDAGEVEDFEVPRKSLEEYVQLLRVVRERMCLVPIVEELEVDECLAPWVCEDEGEDIGCREFSALREVERG